MTLEKCLLHRKKSIILILWIKYFANNLLLICRIINIIINWFTEDVQNIVIMERRENERGEKKLMGNAGPYEENDRLFLICRAFGGKRNILF